MKRQHKKSIKKLIVNLLNQGYSFKEIKKLHKESFKELKKKNKTKVNAEVY